ECGSLLPLSFAIACYRKLRERDGLLSLFFFSTPRYRFPSQITVVLVFSVSWATASCRRIKAEASLRTPQADA
ncbi:MAG: hypothetical protein ACUVQH_13980, partial [Thermogutta sp.]